MGSFFYVLIWGLHCQWNQNAGSLKEELKAIIPELEEMKKRKNDRKDQILEVVEQIREILIEIRPPGYDLSTLSVDECVLSVRRLEELHGQLQLLQVEKVRACFLEIILLI